MIEFPGSKINLGLRVSQKLDNGYHSLESIFLSTNFSDILEIIPLNESMQTQYYFSGLDSV